MPEKIIESQITHESQIRDGISMWLGAVAKAGWSKNQKHEHKLKGYTLNVTPRPIMQGVTTGYTHMRYWDGRAVNVSEIPTSEHLYDLHGPLNYSEEHPFTNGKTIKLERLDEDNPADIAIVVSTPEAETTVPLGGQSRPKLRDEIIVHISHLPFLELEIFRDVEEFMEERRVG